MSEDLTKTEENANAQASQEAARLGRAYHSKANVNIIVDSCADFAPEVVEALGVEVVSFSFVMGGQEHADDFWKSMSPHDFYERMRAGEVATTAAVTPGHYLEVFERAAQKGTPTIYLAFTRGLSSSVDAARQAAESGHSAAEEMLLLATHGMLHLLGYDHATDAEREVMFALQRKLLLTFLATR